MNLLPRISRFQLCLLPWLLAACLVGPKYKQPAATKESLPNSYKESPVNFKDGTNWKVASPLDSLPKGAWWRVFHDSELNELEDQLNINNQNVKQFFQNFMQARALVGEANAQLYPTLTLNPSFMRAKSAKSTPVTSIVTPLSLSWEPDLWGKFRNALYSAQFNAQVSAADLENERLSEQATLAMTYFQLRGQDALQKLLNDTVEADKKALDYNRAQYETGITDKIAMVEAQNTLENAEAAATNVGVARAQYEHAIAVLLGRMASGFSIPFHPLDAEPPPIPLGLPSQLVERRPDVAAAERTMASANAQIGIAVAAYFPSLTLSTDQGFASNRLGNLFSASNHTWSIGAAMSETVFDAGLRAATVRQFVATYNADLAAYRETVFNAFRQVEDYLAQVRILSKQIIQQQNAEKSAGEFLKLETERYKTGIDPYVNVVTAQTTLLTDQQAVITIRTQLMTGAVQLIEALGGGWDKSQLPTPKEVSKKPSKEESAIQH